MHPTSQRFLRIDNNRQHDMQPTPYLQGLGGAVTCQYE